MSKTITMTQGSFGLPEMVISQAEKNRKDQKYCIGLIKTDIYLSRTPRNC